MSIHRRRDARTTDARAGEMPKRLVSQGVLPDVFQKYIMKYLDDTDCNVLSRVSHGCLDAVIGSWTGPGVRDASE